MRATIPALRPSLGVEVARAARARGLDPSALLDLLVERGLDALRESRVAVDRAKKVLDAR